MAHGRRDDQNAKYRDFLKSEAVKKGKKEVTEGTKTVSDLPKDIQADVRKEKAEEEPTWAQKVSIAVANARAQADGDINELKAAGKQLTPDIERSIYDSYSAKIGGLLNGYADAIVRDYSDNPEQGRKELEAAFKPVIESDEKIVGPYVLEAIGKAMDYAQTFATQGVQGAFSPDVAERFLSENKSNPLMTAFYDPIYRDDKLKKKFQKQLFSSFATTIPTGVGRSLGEKPQM